MTKLRKLNAILLIATVLVLALVLAVACDGNNTPDTPATPKKDITGVTFNNATFNYDGEEHEITVNGDIPEGVSVSYTNNKGTDTGTYNATATLSGDGYNTLTLNAVMAIVGNDITGVTFSDATFDYDKLEHEITISGTLPQGVTVTYQNNKATAYGEYTATATLSGKGYNTLTLTAKLTIAAKDITGVTFADRTVTYNGSEYTIDEITGMPAGVTVTSITGNKGTDAGTYNATAEVWGIGYKPLTLTAKLIINKAEITGVTLSDDTIEYDANPHSLTVDGTIPSGVDVAYTYNGQSANSAVEIGEYAVEATMGGKNYLTKTLSATLTIEPMTIRGVTFNSASFEYDQRAHAIYVEGNVPNGVVTVYYYDGVEAVSVSTVGEHDVRAVLSGEKYKTLELTAKLTITSTEEMLYSAYFNGEMYFQNSLDSNKLYRVTSNGNPVKVSNDVATYFTSNSTSLYFYSGGIFNQTIKSLTSGTPSSVYNPGRATYLACDDNGNVYYAKANLIDTKGENGIYKVNINQSEPTPVRLTTDKADYIAYYNGYIYYCNNSNGSRLYRVSVSANNGQGEKLTDEKVSDIIVDGGYVYYTERSGLNSTICKYQISNQKITQLTIDKGAYLTLLDGYIYYVNTDLLTSNIFGKGIYRVSVNGATLGISEKVIEADDGDGYYSLSTDGTSLYYYKRSDKHFYRYSISNQSDVDLMRNFTVDEETTFSASPYAHITTYNGEIYYTNVLDGNSLYKYNPTTKATYKVLTDNVSNVYFYNGYMYYSTFVLTNYALWRVNLSLPEAEPEKISSSRYENLIFAGDYIYAIRITVAGSYNNHIVRMNLDGTQETQIYNKRNVYVSKLYLIDDVFHFCINPAALSLGVSDNIYTHSLNSGLEDATVIGVKSNNFVIYGGKYYYYNHDKKTFCSTDMTTAKETVITQNVEITDIFEYNGVVYYSSSSKQNTGIYAYDVAKGTTTQLTSNVGHGFEVMNGKIYFINLAVTYSLDYPKKGDGDGHLYSIDLATSAVTKVA